MTFQDAFSFYFSECILYFLPGRVRCFSKESSPDPAPVQDHVGRCQNQQQNASALFLHRSSSFKFVLRVEDKEAGESEGPEPSMLGFVVQLRDFSYLVGLFF